MNDGWILLIFIGIPVTVFVLKSWLKDRKNSRLPTYEYKATIMSKQVVVKAIKGPYGLRNNLSNLIVFKLANGQLVELHAPAEMGYPDGTTGTVIFTGTKCEKFTPDK